MGRLIAGVVALAIGVLGAMYWGQAQQADASQREPLVPSIGTQADLTQPAQGECPYLIEHPEKAGSCGSGECSSKGDCSGAAKSSDSCSGSGCEGGGCSHCPGHKDGEAAQTSI